MAACEPNTGAPLEDIFRSFLRELVEAESKDWQAATSVEEYVEAVQRSVTEMLPDGEDLCVQLSTLSCNRKAAKIETSIRTAISAAYRVYAKVFVPLGDKSTVHRIIGCCPPVRSAVDGQAACGAAVAAAKPRARPLEDERRRTRRPRRHEVGVFGAGHVFSDRE